MDEKLPIKVTVLIEFREYLKANYIFILKRMWFFPVFLLIIAAAGVIFTDHSKATFLNAYIYLLIFPLIFILMIAGIYMSSKQAMKSLPALSQNILYSFDDSGIEAEGTTFDQRMGWNMIIKAEEAANMIVLYSTPTTGYFLPLRCFRDEEQIREFKNFIRIKLGSKAKLK
jgi:hypothetical protein